MDYKGFAQLHGQLCQEKRDPCRLLQPEFLSAAQALLFALSSADRVRTTGQESPAQKAQLTQFNINLQQYKDSLKNLGMGISRLRR